MRIGNDDTLNCVFIQVPTESQIRQIVALYRDQGWWQPCDEGNDSLVHKLIAGSHCFVVATDGESILGMGRAISDGVSDAYIQDVTVRNDCRNRGIATKILQTILERLREDTIPWIGLIAEPGASNLYRRAGFREMSASIPMLMTKKP